MRKALLVLSALAALVASGCGSTSASDSGPLVSGVTTSDHDGYEGIVMPTAFQVPDTTLTTDDGTDFSMRRDTEGKLTLTFFGYTHCPDVCQIVMGTIASAYARLDDAQKRAVQVLFVTTDPARDTPKELKAYLARLDPSFIGLTGSLTAIDKTGTPLHVFIKKGRQLPSGGYEVDHTTTVFGIDGHGTAPIVWDGTTSPAQLSGDIDKLLAKGTAETSAR